MQKKSGKLGKYRPAYKYVCLWRVSSNIASSFVVSRSCVRRMTCIRQDLMLYAWPTTGPKLHKMLPSVSAVSIKRFLMEVNVTYARDDIRKNLKVRV